MLVFTGRSRHHWVGAQRGISTCDEWLASQCGMRLRRGRSGIRPDFLQVEPQMRINDTTVVRTVPCWGGSGSRRALIGHKPSVWLSFP